MAEYVRLCRLGSTKLSEKIWAGQGEGSGMLVSTTHNLDISSGVRSSTFWGGVQDEVSVTVLSLLDLHTKLLTE
jgi:hypothetical protein